MTSATPRPHNDTVASKVLFVDPAVMHADILLDGRSAGMEVYRLENGRGALGQIAHALLYRRDIAELHILSHGEPGSVVLCGTRIDLNALTANGPTLEAIAATLCDDASVVLYGCSVASGSDGRRFVEALELALHAHVAASTGPVGEAGLGGSWDVRASTGKPIELGFTAEARAAFPGLLVC